MCVTWSEPPGLTQVDEKGHKGNTANATPYLCWRKHGQRNGRTPFSSFFSIFLLFSVCFLCRLSFDCFRFLGGFCFVVSLLHHPRAACEPANYMRIPVCVFSSFFFSCFFILFFFSSFPFYISIGRRFVSSCLPRGYHYAVSSVSVATRSANHVEFSAW